MKIRTLLAPSARRIKDACIGLVVGLALVAAPLLADQSQLWSPTSGTVSGLNLTNNFNAAINALATCNSGAAAPANPISAAPVAGQCWYNTSTGAVSTYDGANWLLVGYLDATNHVWTPVIGGGAATNVASAATTNLCGASGAAPIQSSNLTITGTTGITGFGSNCGPGVVKIVTFSGALTLTYNGTSLILPGGVNITTAPGDTAVAISLGSGNWRLLYFPATGLPAAPPALANNCDAPLNLGLSASVGSSALTVNLLGANGSTPSALNPVWVCFRSTTLTAGAPVWVPITSALSIVVPSGATLGTASGIPFRLWVFLAYNSGAPELAIAKCSSTTAIYPCAAWQTTLKTTVAISSGATSVGVPYATTGVSNDALRIIGYAEGAETTGGTWSAGPTILQVAGYGVRLPGDIVQIAPFIVTSSPTSCGATIMTVPTAVTQSITPTSFANLVHITALSYAQTGAGGLSIYQISRGSGPILLGIAVGFGPVPSAAILGSVAEEVIDDPQTTSPQAYTVYCQAGTTAFTSSGGTILLQEIMGALEPANDDRRPPMAKAA